MSEARNCDELLDMACGAVKSLAEACEKSLTAGSADLDEVGAVGLAFAGAACHLSGTMLGDVPPAITAYAVAHIGRAFGAGRRGEGMPMPQDAPEWATRLCELARANRKRKETERN